MKQMLLKCEVLDGMFSEEKVVTYLDPSGDYVSFFVPKEITNVNRVKVSTFKNRLGKSFIIIPNDGYREIIQVREKDLEAIEERENCSMCKDTGYIVDSCDQGHYGQKVMCIHCRKDIKELKK